MEMGKQPYLHVIQMPVQRLKNYLKWKSKLEEEKRKMLEDNLDGQ